MNSNSFVLAFFLLAAPLRGEDVDYQKDIKPIFAAKCAACHGAIHQEADLRLDAGKLIHQGSENGSVIDLAAPKNSKLLARVLAEDADERMPPEGLGERLLPAQIQVLQTWIAAGAKFPDDESIPQGPKSHWAYQPPVRAEVPPVNSAEWSGNPIDAFIYIRLQQAGLQPVPLADRETQLRRIYLDLIGLPPSPSQQRDFLASESATAWPQVVDQLLEDPAYGERWGKHWMDVWRYSDWDGYKDDLRGSQRHIWRWRDWIIESLNADKPYDRMIAEMLAGDELAPEDRSTLRATGYLARSFHGSNRDIWLDATVEHTAKAFLGMTINCARCHDHKFDPIGQREYYAMRAIFEPHHVRTERIPGQSNLKQAGFVRAYDAKPDEPTYLYAGGNEKRPDKEHPLQPAPPKFFQLPYEPQPIDLPPLAIFPALHDFIEQEDLTAARSKFTAAETALAKAQEKLTDEDQVADIEIQAAAERVAAAAASLTALEARWKADKAKFGGEKSAETLNTLAQAACTAERLAAVRSSQLAVTQAKVALSQAEKSAEADAAKRKTALEKAQKEFEAAEKTFAAAEKAAQQPSDAKYTSVGVSYPAKSTGRRLALARWITNSRNPLAARVAVNHIWLRHFGTPLVDNVFDFGMRSANPVQRDLLDWLAVEFRENGWSMKHVHRLILTSRAYRSASHADPAQFAANYKRDPDNRFFWRANVRRLDAEVIRDSMLQLAGSLDHTFGGPDLDEHQGETVPRKSLYFRHAYEKQMPLLVSFDAASPTECYRRSESIVPQQALALANSALSLEQARILAKKLTESDPEVEPFIRAAFVTILCRECTAEELAACRDFLATQAKLLAQPDKLQDFQSKLSAKIPPAAAAVQRARENLVHVLFNHNDFVTVR
jgi:hypothetical protein